MGELTHDEQTAALEGWSTNPMVSLTERLAVAHQVIDRLHARERERIRTAVVETLRYARVNWMTADRSPEERRIADDLENAEALTRNWGMEPGWCCPFCEEVACDEDCPLARVREELG